MEVTDPNLGKEPGLSLKKYTHRHTRMNTVVQFWSFINPLKPVHGS